MIEREHVLALCVSTHNLAIKQALGILNPSASEIRLACGELTAQEMRTVKAVLAWKRGKLEKLFKKQEGL